jgi:hypothetical protein
MILNQLSDEDLLSNTHGAVHLETEATTNVVRHFKEIYVRDLYLARGFSSMYLMAVEEFGYDSSSALRRTHALELALAVPSVLEKIDQGELCLQSAADIQTFLNKERGAKKPYSSDLKAELVEKCSGLSSRDIQIELAGRNPDVRFHETKKMISKNQIRVTYVTRTTTEEKLERIKALRSHVNPYVSRDELLDYMAERTLDQIDPLRKAERAEKRTAKKARNERPAQAVRLDLHVREEIVSEVGEIHYAVHFGDVWAKGPESAFEPEEDVVEISCVTKLNVAYAAELSSVTALAKQRRRYVSAVSDRAVRKANGDLGCEFKDEQTGRRCSSKHQEQRDHILEFSKGGSNEPENLQIYCAKHNRYRWRTRSRSHVSAEQNRFYWQVT